MKLLMTPIRYILLFLAVPFLAHAQDVDSLISGLKENYSSAETQSFLQSIKAWPGLSNQERLEYTRKAGTYIAKKKDPADRMVYDQTIGILYNRLNGYDSALKYFNDGLALAYELNDSLKIAHLLNNRATTFWYQGRLEKALQSAVQSQEIAEQILDTARMTANLNLLGSIQNFKGNYESATKYYIRALEVLEGQRNLVMEAQVLGNLAVIMGKMEDYLSALIYTRKAIVLYQEINEMTGLSNSLTNLGHIYYFLNELDSSILCYDSALHVAIRSNDAQNIAIGLTNKAKVLAEKGDYKESTSLYDQGIAFCLDRGLMYHLSIFYHEKAKILLEQDRFAEAERYFELGTEIARQEGYRDFVREYYLSLATLNKKKGNTARAFDYLERYTLLNDSLLNENNQRTIAEMQTRFDTELKEQEISLLTKDLEIQSFEISRKQNQLIMLIVVIVSLLVVFFLAFLVYRLRQQKYRVQLEKKNIEIERQLLRSQMNPHFIFNSLNSIQSYISTNDGFKAMSYLSKFARLMRLILDNSRKSSIPLEDEVTTLELYLELEKLRFGDKFDFSLTVDQDLPVDKTYIPPMLVQPLVENAIKHGFRDLERQGMLELSFARLNGTIHCVVQDNGIGREAAETLPREGEKKGGSLGIKLTMERLTALHNETGREAGLHITDLKDGQGKPIGTKAELRIPYEED